MPDIDPRQLSLAAGWRLVTTGQVVLRGAWAPGADNPTKVFGSVWSADGRTLDLLPGCQW